MGSSYSLCAYETINNKAYEKVLDEKNEPPKRNLDIINKNFITNDNHSNNSGIIANSKKMKEYENIKSEKDILSIASLYILKYIFSFLSEKQKFKIIIYNKDIKKN